MKDNKLILTVKDSKVDFQHDSPVSLQEILCVFLPIIEGLINLGEELILQDEEYIAECKQEKVDPAQRYRDEMFDFMNAAYSSSLSRIDPEGELHPTLTEKAIREAEDKIVTEGRLNEVKAGS